MITLRFQPEQTFFPICPAFLVLLNLKQLLVRELSVDPHFGKASPLYLLLTRGLRLSVCFFTSVSQLSIAQHVLKAPGPCWTPNQVSFSSWPAPWYPPSCCRSSALEVLALDGASTGALQFSTAQDCADWLRAISTNISELTLQHVSKKPRAYSLTCLH